MKYLKKHRYQNQKNVIDGIPIDPILRDEFDVTDNNERPQDEINDWWGKPYIITDTLDDVETFEELLARAKEENFTPSVKTKEEWDAKMQKQKESWFESFPSGTRYMVRCLDGGAWDRSTNKGSYPTLEEALKVAKNAKGN
ncbi:hypothetical protein [Sulfuricurvum sp.]|uniref:hypothetical protein n=1 Tax=Sulfuricurvum sp. TaxID=2025608 RepID=UPI002623ABD8|nr:hypothetical protein [Sulfuricurvum sp.]MDD2782108.1 hypothetical protein [Sulfuricurvum sp.]